MLPGAHDALSVRLIEKAGFQAFTLATISSFGITAFVEDDLGRVFELLGVGGPVAV